MKMLKKIAGVLAASALAVSMVACDIPFDTGDLVNNGNKTENSNDDNSKDDGSEIKVPSNAVNFSNGIIFGTFNGWNPDNKPALTKNFDGSFTVEIEVTKVEEKGDFCMKLVSDETWAHRFGDGNTTVGGEPGVAKAITESDNDPAFEIKGVKVGQKLVLTIYPQENTLIIKAVDPSAPVVDADKDADNEEDKAPIDKDEEKTDADKDKVPADDANKDDDGTKNPPAGSEQNPPANPPADSNQNPSANPPASGEQNPPANPPAEDEDKDTDEGETIVVNSENLKLEPENDSVVYKITIETPSELAKYKKNAKVRFELPVTSVNKSSDALGSEIIMQVVDNGSDVNWWKAISEEDVKAVESGKTTVWEVTLTEDLSKGETGDKVQKVVIFFKVKDAADGKLYVNEELPAAGPATTTVVKEFDFSGATLPECYNKNEGATHVVNDGLKIDVNQSWDGALMYDTAIPDFSEVTKIIITMKKDEAASFQNSDCDQIYVSLLNKAGAPNYETTGYSQTCVYDDSDAATKLSSEYAEYTVDVSWELKSDTCESLAALTELKAFGLNTTSLAGSVYIKSIKFVK